MYIRRNISRNSKPCLKPLARLQSMNRAKCGCPTYIDGSIVCTLVPSTNNRINDNSQYAKEINFANRLRYYQLRKSNNSNSSKQQQLSTTLSQTNTASMITILLLSLIVSIATSHKIASKNSLQYFRNDIERIIAVVNRQHHLNQTTNHNNNNNRLEHRNGNSDPFNNNNGLQLDNKSDIIARDRRSRPQQFVNSQQVRNSTSNQDERLIRMPSTNYSKYSLWQPLITTTLIDVPSDKSTDQSKSLSTNNLHNNNNNSVSSSFSHVIASLEPNSSLIVAPSPAINSNSSSSSSKRSNSDVSMASSNRNTLVANITNLTDQQQDDDIIAAAPFLESPLNSAVVSSSPSPSMISSNYAPSSDDYNNDKKVNNREESSRNINIDGEDSGHGYGKKVLKTTKPRRDSNEDEPTHHNQKSSGNFVVRSDGLTRMSSDNQPVQRDGNKKRRDGDLEAFLENMNHMELRAAAFGRPLPNSFLEKPLESPQKVAVTREETAKASVAGGELAHMQSHHHHTNYHHMLHHQQSRHKQDRESYSDCALILQRTYVRNSNHK